MGRIFCVVSVQQPVDNLAPKEESKLDNIRNIAQQVLNVILGIGLIGTVIYWLLFLYNSFQGDRNVTALIANVIMVLIILIFTYKILGKLYTISELALL